MKCDFLYVAVLFVILGVSVVLSFDCTEHMTSGIYPDSVTKPLLDGVYKVKKNPGYDIHTTSYDVYRNYPSFASKHCGTNNLRYWRRPTNGRCTPIGMCTGLYDTTEPSIPDPPNPPKGTRRVNYFVYKD